MSVDLHLHTTCSDGTLSPRQTVEEAVRVGVTAISITDHDTVEATADAQEAARGTHLAVVPGVEMSCDYGRTEVHVLGYYVDTSSAALRERLRAVREARVVRAEQMAARLRNLGVPLTLADVRRAAEVGKGDGPGNQSLGRPHVAAALVAGGHCATLQEAFDRYLKKGRPAYVPRYKLTPVEAVHMVREAGGCPVLAHPGLIVGERDLPRRLVPEGLAGIEAYHPEHGAADTQRLLRLAEELGLLVTGGSDSHGPAAVRPVAIGAVPVPDACAARLQEWWAARMAPPGGEGSCA